MESRARPIPYRPHPLGRADLLANINYVDLLVHQNRHLVLHGVGGIGKSTLAITISKDEELKAAFGERIFFIACNAENDRIDLRAFKREVLRIHPTPPAEGEEPTIAIANELRSHQSTLLILDNFESVEVTKKLGELLEGLGSLSGVSLIITTRSLEHQEYLETATSYITHPVPTLDLDSSRALFLQLAPRFTPIADADSTSDGNLDELLTCLDGLPLAITSLAMTAQVHFDFTIDKIVTMHKQHTGLFTIDGKRNYLSASLRLSIDSLSDLSRDILVLLCLFPSPRESALFDEVEDNIETAKSDLMMTTSFIQQSSDKSYNILAPVSELVKELVNKKLLATPASQVLEIFLRCFSRRISYRTSHQWRLLQEEVLIVLRLYTDCTLSLSPAQQVDTTAGQLSRTLCLGATSSFGRV